MSRIRQHILTLIAATAVIVPLGQMPAGATAATRPTLTITPIVTGLTIPWDVAQTPDGTLLFDQREGGLSVRRTGGGVNALSADFSDLYANGETGLMGLVLDPGFVGNRRFYTCQGHQDATGKDIRVIAWTVNAGYTTATRVANPLLGGIPANADIGRHGGCRLRFDSSGMLMVGTGDTATGSAPQDLTSLAGKVLRINPKTGAPAAGNPGLLARNPNTRLLWNYGHRNVQGLALRPNGQMFNVEQGTYRDDEVNVVLPARNYGYDPDGPNGTYDESVPMTDLQKFPNAQVASWSSGPTTDATSGAGFVYGAQWGSWSDSLIVAELKNESLLRLTFDRVGHLTSQEYLPEFTGAYGRLRTAQLGTDGALYVTTSNGDGTDKILRVTSTA